MTFPDTFFWGVASASYQIEGGAYEDDKALSIWDTFSHINEKIYGNHNGDTACDSYHRYEEDLDLIASMNVHHYRFSLSWPRILSTDDGSVNIKGLAYYDKLVDGCLKRDIEPWITLYHWDLPQYLEDKGGWLNRDTCTAFEEYTKVVVAHFKDRVKKWITINEPQCVVGLGYGTGIHAPGKQLSYEETFTAWHHVMLAHGLSCKVIRESIPDAMIGIASTGNLVYFDNQNLSLEQRRQPTDARLTEATFFASEQNPWNYFYHTWFLDPLIKGSYPDDTKCPWYPFSLKVDTADLQCIQQPIDFIGLNIYNGHEMQEDTATKTLRFVKKYDGYPRTAQKWPITPDVMYWGPRIIYERYHLPVVITENGLSCNDKIYLDGKVHDPDRIDFLHRYLKSVETAIDDGVPIIGYLQWSLLDNFEWYQGYEERFGLIYVDYRTKDRIKKDSADWYAKVVKNNRLPD